MKPNPADDRNSIVIYSENANDINASLRLSDSNGVLISENHITLHNGVNEFPYQHQFRQTGVYIIQLVLDVKVIAARSMVFTR